MTKLPINGWCHERHADYRATDTLGRTCGRCGGDTRQPRRRRDLPGAPELPLGQLEEVLELPSRACSEGIHELCLKGEHPEDANCDCVCHPDEAERVADSYLASPEYAQED